MLFHCNLLRKSGSFQTIKILGTSCGVFHLSLKLTSISDSECAVYLRIFIHNDKRIPEKHITRNHGTFVHLWLIHNLRDSLCYLSMWPVTECFYKLEQVGHRTVCVFRIILNDKKHCCLVVIISEFLCFRYALPLKQELNIWIFTF